MLSCAADVDAADAGGTADSEDAGGTADSEDAAGAVGAADSEDAADAVGAVDAEPEHAVTEAESMSARAHAASDDGIFPMPFKNVRMIIKYLLFCH